MAHVNVGVNRSTGGLVETKLNKEKHTFDLELIQNNHDLHGKQNVQD